MAGFILHVYLLSSVPKMADLCYNRKMYDVSGSEVRAWNDCSSAWRENQKWKEPDMAVETNEEKQIDQIDEQIIRLFQERMKLSEKVSEQRILEGSRILDRKGDMRRLDKMESLGSDDFSRKAIRQIGSQLQSIARKRQYQMMRENGAEGKLPFVAVDSLDTENIRVVYQGVEGAYSHAATRTFFGEDVNCFHVDSFRDAMEAIADGAADYAVLPIENSSAGIVADNYDLMMEFENYVVGEQVIKIEHVLMGVPGAKMEDIQAVYSHPQALAQCEPFLAEHENWEIVPYGNTAMAARKIARDGDMTHAAIGSAFAAERFGLEILREHVYHTEANSTRFIVVSNQRIFCKNANKISISFEVPHRSGSLHEILSQFTYNNLNMYQIESRPILDKNWEYRMFVDFEGNLAQSSVKSALRGLRSEAVNLRIIGNY